MNKVLIFSLIAVLSGSLYLFNQSQNSEFSLPDLKQSIRNNDEYSDFLANWVGELQPLIGDLNYFDLSVPGTHDTFTYDLSEIFADHANDIPTQLAWVLHNFISNLYTFGNFGKTQGQTQTLDITQQLDNGVRWIDFRAVYTQDGVKSLTSNWYSLHFMQSEQKFKDLAQQIRDWLDIHDKEIITIQISYHGNPCDSDANDYPGISESQRQKCWNSFLDIFQDILYNSDTQKPLNEMSVNDLLEANTRVIAYVSQWEVFTESSPYAQNGCQVVQDGGSSLDNEESALEHELDFFENVAQKKKELKAENKFYSKSMVTSEGGSNIFYDFLLRYVPDLPQDYQNYFDLNNVEEECANIYTIPNNGFCPKILRDMGQWTNYYKQISLSIANQKNYEFPNTVFIDQLDYFGTIRIGTEVLETPVKDQGPQTTENARFGFSSLLIIANLKQVCNLDAPSQECQKYLSLIQSNINEYREYRWNEDSFGRLQNWPM